METINQCFFCDWAWQF